MKTSNQLGGIDVSTQASFELRGRNPDVLTCIANLSNDEVFHSARVRQPNA